MSEVSIADYLSKGRYHSSVIATYNCDFGFYEGFVLRRLMGAECRNNILLVDAKQAADTAFRGDFAPTRGGLDYTLVPVQATGVWHPKFVLLVGEKHADLFVGSHNLSLGGWSANEELTTHFDLSTDDGVCAELTEFVHAWTGEMEEEQRERLERALAGSWEKEVGESGQMLFGSRPVGPPLWDRVRPELGADAIRVRVLSPYFDSAAAFVRSLAEGLDQRAELVVATDPLRGAVPEALLEIGADVRRVVARRPEREDAFFHAKLLAFDHPDGVTLVTGSANASRPAWLGPPEARNAELVVVGRFAGLEIEEALQLETIFGGSQITRADLHRVLPEIEEGRSGASGAVVLVERNGSFEGQVEGAGVVAVRVLPGGDEMLFHQGEGERLALSDVPLSVTAVSIEREGGSTLVGLLHRTAFVVRASQTRQERALRQLLADLAGGSVALEGILSAVSEVIFESRSTSSLSPAGGGREATELLGAIDLGVDVDSDGSEDGTANRPSKDLFLLIDALLARLKMPEAASSGPADDAMLIDTDDERMVSLERKVSDEELEVARQARSKVEELVRRLEMRVGKDDWTIAQVVAVLGITAELRVREAEWQNAGRHLSFVDGATIQALDSILRKTAFGPRGPVHRDEPYCADLRAFALWMQHVLGRRRQALRPEPRLRKHDSAHRQERRDVLESLQPLLESCVEVGADSSSVELAEHLFTKTCGADDRTRAFAWLRDHLEWGAGIHDAMANAVPSSAFAEGDIVSAKLDPRAPLFVVTADRKSVNTAGPGRGFGNGFVRLAWREELGER